MGNITSLNIATTTVAAVSLASKHVVSFEFSSSESWSSYEANHDSISDSLDTTTVTIPSSKHVTSLESISSDSLESSSGQEFPSSTDNSYGSSTLENSTANVQPTSLPNHEMLSSTSKQTDIFQVSYPPVMHGFFGGYIAGVASVIITIMAVALVVYIRRTRRRHDAASPDVKSVSVLPSGVYQEYNGGQSVVKGAAGAKGGLGDEYQEITINCDKFNATAKKRPHVSPDNEYVYEMIASKSDNQPTYSNVTEFQGRATNIQSTIV